MSRSPSSPAHDTTDAGFIADTQRWIECAVIGLNLCPFARAPFVQDRVRLHVSHARTADALRDDLHEELRFLHDADPADCETSLLILSSMLADFADFNDFLDVADDLLRALDFEGEIQVASFHPDYQFADAAADAIENATNRSPWPTLHLLRESSIDRAIEAMPDTDAIYQRNIETLRQIGTDGWRKLRLDSEDGPIS